MIRQAVILAAGNGTRMRKDNSDPYMLNTPKPLLDVKGMPIIKHSIRNLSEIGMDIAVVIKRKDEQMFREKLAGYNITYCYQDQPLGTAHALFCARDFVKDDLFLVMMGDDIYSIDMSSIPGMDKPAIFGHHLEDVSSFGSIITDSDGIVTEIKEKSMSGSGIANTGIAVMPRLFFNIYNSIPADQRSGERYLTHAASILYETGKGFRLINLEYWKGINTPDDLASVNSVPHEKISIREARNSDFSRIVEILDELSPFDDVSMSMHDSRLKSALNGILSDRSHYLAVAEADGTVVSTATLLIQKNITHGGRPYGHIENVVTDERYRGNSIGRKMVEHLLGVAKSRNCYKVILDCSQENTGFYRKCGFETNGEVEMRINF